MTTLQKASLSLLISVIIFAVFSVLAFTGLFDFFEANFYNPSVTSSLINELEKDAEAIDEFLLNNHNRFLTSLYEPAVRRSFLLELSNEDIYERSRIYGNIHESLSGLQWVRFIDSGGISVNFSTLSQDILLQDSAYIAYRNFPGLSGALPYEQIVSEAGSGGRFIIDEIEDRILFSFPFHDAYDVYRGTALFSLSIRALSEYLISEGRIKAGEDVSVINYTPGAVIGKPLTTGRDLFPQITAMWRQGLNVGSIVSSTASGVVDPLVLLTSKTGSDIFISHIYNESVFSFPELMRLILLISFFLTIYLTIFLLFNIRQDPIAIVQNRLMKLQSSLIEQFYDKKGSLDWNRWSREFEQRGDEIKNQLKRGLKAKKNKVGDNDIDYLVDKSWEELLSVITGRRETSIDEAKLKAILKNILSDASATPGAVSTYKAETKPDQKSITAKIEQLNDIENIEDIEEIEEVEEIEALEEVEELEELEEIDTVDDDVEEDAGTLEPIEELEPIADAAPAEKTAAPKPFIDIDELASKIEFTNVENLNDLDEMLSDDLEIASPFQTMFNKIEDSPKESKSKKPKQKEVKQKETKSKTSKKKADDGEPIELIYNSKKRKKTEPIKSRAKASGAKKQAKAQPKSKPAAKEKAKAQPKSKPAAKPKAKK